MRDAQSKTPILGLSIVFCVGAIALAATFLGQKSERPEAPPIQFEERPLEPSMHLFDLGVADINSDGWLDIFSTNHSARQSILLNEAGVRFQDRLIELGLSQNAAFPGVEPTFAEPDFDEPGIYIFWYRSFLVIRSHHFSAPQAIDGNVILSNPVLIVSDGGVTARSDPAFDDRKATRIEFNISRDGTLYIASRSFYLFSSLSFDEKQSLSRIFVGAQKINPRAHKFNLALRDRHAMAWTDINADNRFDAFVARGGGGGKTRTGEHSSRDEL